MCILSFFHFFPLGKDGFGELKGYRSQKSQMMAPGLRII